MAKKIKDKAIWMYNPFKGKYAWVKPWYATGKEMKELFK